MNGTLTAKAPGARGAHRLRALGRLVWFALPSTLVVGLSGLFLVIDTYFVSRLGPDVLLGVSLVFPLYLILVMVFGGGLGVGLSVVVSMSLGRGDEAKARVAAGNALALALGLSVVLGGLGLWGGPALFARLAPSAGAAVTAWQFGWPVFSATPLIATALSITNLLRSEKRLGAAAAMMLAGGLVNTALNPVLIHGWGGAPALGATGAGLATGAGYAVSCLFGLCLLRRQRRLALRWGHLRPSWATIKSLVGIALPTVVTYVVNNAALLALLALFAKGSPDAGVAFGLATRLEYLLVLALYGLGGALMTLAGEARGAGKTAEAHQVFRLAGLAALLGTVPVCAALWIWPEPWFRLFGATAAALQVGARYLRAAAPAYPLYAYALTLNYAFQTMGRAGTGLLLTALRGWLIAVPGAALALALAGHLGPVIWVIVASFVLHAVAAWWVMARAMERETAGGSGGGAPVRGGGDLPALELPGWTVTPYPLAYSLLWPWYFRVPSTRNHSGLERPPLRARLSLMEQPTVRICAIGDVMVMQGDRVPEFSPELVALLSSADQIIGCCEAPLGKHERDPGARYSFMFNMPVEYLRGIIEASGAPPDRWALTLANNHVADVGGLGPEITYQRLRSIGVTPLGRRVQGDQHPLHVVQRRGLRLGLASWTQWLNVDQFAPGDARVWRLPEVVTLPWRRLREELGLDALIGSTHWEYEWQHFPRKETRAMAGALHRAGFDLLVGSHQHVLQSFERHAHGLTLYGMGNFCSGLGRAWPARMTSVAEIELGTRGADRGRVVAYRLHLFAQVNGGERIQLLPLERVPSPLRGRIRERVSKLFEVAVQPCA